jgi:hypothetical protein
MESAKIATYCGEFPRTAVQLDCRCSSISTYSVLAWVVQLRMGRRYRNPRSPDRRRPSSHGRSGCATDGGQLTEFIVRSQRWSVGDQNGPHRVSRPVNGTSLMIHCSRVPFYASCGYAPTWTISLFPQAAHSSGALKVWLSPVPPVTSPASTALQFKQTYSSTSSDVCDMVGLIGLGYVLFNRR